MDVRIQKRRFSANLFIMVCYLMISIGDTGASDSSSSSPSDMTTNGTQESTAQNITTMNYETSTTDANGNTTISTDTSMKVTNTSGTYPNGTNATGTVPKWIPTTVISIICGLLFVITITTIVCHSRKIATSDVESDGGAQEYVDVSKSDIHQTQEYVDVSKSDIHQTQEYVDVSKSDIHQTQEYVDVSKSDIHQTQEYLNKSPNKHCSKAMPPEKEEKPNLDIISGRGDYDEVLLDGTPAGKYLTEKDECHVVAKSKDVLKKDVAFSDIEAEEISSKKESSKQRESPVYAQSKKKNIYSHVTSKTSLKNKAESFATSENQHVQGNQENFSNYDHVDLNAKMSINEETEYLDMNYDHIHLDRKPNMGSERDFTSQPLSVENILLEDLYDNASNSFRDKLNTVDASELYSKVSVKCKHDQEVDKHISDGALEKEDSNCKESEQDKVVGEKDTNVYYNTDKLKNFSKSTDKETDVKPENKLVISQSLLSLKIASQKQESDSRAKSKQLSSVSGMATLGNINLENMENVSVLTPNVSVTNDASAIKGGENLKEGSTFRIKEKNCKEATATEYQQSTKSQKSIRSDYEEVETAL